jgi:transposase
MIANARLTPVGRLTLCLRIEEGRPVAHVASEMGISRATGYKWRKRFCEEGVEREPNGPGHPAL